MEPSELAESIEAIEAVTLGDVETPAAPSESSESPASSESSDVPAAVEPAPAGRPHLRLEPTQTPSEAVVLLLHGGPERGFREARRWGAPYLRMLPFGLAVRRRSGDRIAVVRVRHRHNGWNGWRESTAAETQWALDDIAEAAPGLPIGVLGHSLGGRTAVRVAGHPAVRSVVALAPWLPPGEDVTSLRDRDVLIVHGTRDAVCPIAETEQFVARAAEAGVPVHLQRLPGVGHLMVRGARRWHDLAAEHLVRTLLPED